jgi:hypothetical protein
VRRVLLDENLPRLLRRSFPEFEIRTVQEEGWGSFQNGQLLRRAEGTFDVLLTADRRMQYQQTLASFALGVVVIVTPRLQLGNLCTGDDDERTLSCGMKYVRNDEDESAILAIAAGR